MPRCRWSPLATLLLAACSGARDPLTPPAQPVLLEPRAPLLQYAGSSEPVDTLPSLVVRDTAGNALIGAAVQFTEVRGTTTLRTVTVMTDSTGRAQLPTWTPSQAGLHTVVARAGAGATAQFRVVALPAPLMRDPLRQRCPLVDSVLPRFPGLDSTRRRLRAGDSLVVVALGASSTVGVGATAPGRTYVAQMAAQLRAAYPRATIVMHNAGVVANVTTQMLARLDRDVLARQPHLVVVQPGTNEAVHYVSKDTVRLAVDSILARLRARAVDAVLLDAQFYRGHGESDLFRSYSVLVRTTGAARGVGTARRYDWMRTMLRTGRARDADLISSDGFHTTDWAYECTARLLTVGIAAAVEEDQTP